ncbi:MAG TPA: M15 family metallopeptidase [Flavipsychrobacter sp.]|nr:M15 family metallopeptidase [Flavipsychrobacter sp.]
MSYQFLKQDQLFYQRFLKSHGFYTGKLDGVWGPKTDAADKAFMQHSQNIAKQIGSFDHRSESNLITLAPKVQTLARQFLKLCQDAKLDVRIISGTRTYAEQEALFRKGRYGNTEKRVTNARGGQSNHNFGIAWDIGVFQGGKYLTTLKPYKDIATLVMPHFPNLAWGGHWISFPDYPHYEHKATVDGVAHVRGLFENGKVYV